MKLPWLLLLVLFVVMSSLSGKKVLIISIPMISQMNGMNIVGEELSKIGHTVYQAVPQNFADFPRVINTDIIKPLFYRVTDEKISADDLAALLKEKGVWKALPITLNNFYDQCRCMMEDEDFQDTLKDIGFDLMLINGFGLVQCRYIVPYHLGVPYVYQFSSMLEWNMRIPMLPSFAPAFTGMDLGWYVSDRMSFQQRVINLFAMFLDLAMMPVPFFVDNSLLDEYAPGLSWTDLMRKSELFLVTRDHMLEWPTIGFPNVITTPGITLRPAKPLPADLDAIFASAQQGVIVVSFGSTAGDFTEDVMSELFQGLGRMKQAVVMRYVGDIEEGKTRAPENLHLMSWMPQQDMLAHNNTVAFVTHCGNNGQYEGLYNGVPMLGIPLFAEQRHNAFRAVSHGYGLTIDDISTMKAADLSAALGELIENEKYRENVHRASLILKSDPLLPREKMAYWVDHVMQHGGSHLRPSAMDMSLTSLFMLDVAAFLAVMFAIAVYVMYRLRCCCTRKSKAKQE